MSNRTDVFACERQPIVVEALNRILTESGQFRFVGASAVLVDGLERIRLLLPRIVLVDESYGWSAIGRFLAAVSMVSPGSVAVLWTAEGNDWTRAFEAGARAVLRKTMPVSTLLQCLRAVAAGHVWTGDPELPGLPGRRSPARLTSRERDIVRGVCQGLRNREIAEQLGITAGTVKVHMMHVFEKTGVKSRFELAAEGGRLLSDPVNSREEPDQNRRRVR